MKEILEKHGLWQMVAAAWVIGLLLIMMIIAWKLPENLAAVSAFLLTLAS